VETDQGIYYISIGFGKIDDIYAISIESPMGALLKSKKIGDSIEMRGRTITIKKIE
jgi:transcription elongation GreA/GreB family factor